MAHFAGNSIYTGGALSAERDRLRSLLPDLPRWIETRDLLSCRTCPLHVDPQAEQPSFVVVDDVLGKMASVVGHPAAALIREAVADSRELLAFQENVTHVRSALPEWRAEGAILHVLDRGPEAPAPPRHATRYLRPGEVRSLNHLDPELLEELAAAEDEGVEIAAAFDGELPVAFCYAGAASETLWDVAIDTALPYRRRGFAQAAAYHVIGDQADRGLTPVWGALETNVASIGLARKLGFVEVDRIWVLVPTL